MALRPRQTSHHFLRSNTFTMDDLISLDWSSSSSSSKTAPLSAPPKPSHASFDLFAQPKPLRNGVNYHSSTPPLKSATPTLTPIPASALLQPQASGSRPRSASPNPVSPPSHDAFSSLFSLNGSSSSENKNLSLAERQAQAIEEKRQKADRERAQFEAHSSFWDNLGSSKPSPEPDSAKVFGNMLQPATAPLSRPTSAVPQVSVDPWDDDDGLLGAGPSSIKQASTSSSSRQPTPLPPDDPFDFDALAARTSQLRVEEKAKGSSGMRTPVSDFDFGEKDEAGSDEDVLGDLGRPAKPLSEAIETSPSPLKPSRRPRPPRSDSPPPHVIGRIVEMGFSPQQARQALARTTNGMEVEGAIDSLLAQQGSSQVSNGEDDTRRREEAERERRRKRRAGPSRDSVRARTKDEISTGSQPEFGDQADKFIAQATEIGQSVFSKATTLWNTGREKALKAYEEQRKAMDTERPREVRKDGRPRWMVERDEQEQNGRPGEEVAQGFKDNDSFEEESPKRQPKPNGRLKPHEQRKPREEQRVADDLLFDSEPPPRASGSRAKLQARPPVQAAPPRPKTPLVKRILVNASSSQLDAAASHKAAGNEHFKLGRFPEAEASYTRAITGLPEGHLHLVPLYNNRAATRLKAGDSAAAMADSTIVISIIGMSYHPAKEEPLPPDLASEVKLSDALVKAMIKRAQAAEMAEKWALAAEDWERVVGLDPAILGNSSVATRALAAEGGRRSRKMLAGPKSPKTARAPTSAALKAPTRSRPADLSKSEAVAELRKAAAANEAEDAQRQGLKDQVDARVQAWQSGKEENLRALIASLDTVLWDEILAGGLKVGMHELIREKQVKIKYMKVVARLHPDKLNVSNTTVEQRMLASAVFGILSDAWQSFNK